MRNSGRCRVDCAGAAIVPFGLMPVNPVSTRRLGATDVEVTVLGFGGATIGGISRVLTEAQAQETLAAAFDTGIRLFDTAPSYGNGQSEHRIGAQFRERLTSGCDRADLVLATKVGKLLGRPRAPDAADATEWPGGLPFRIRWDFTYGGVMRAYEDSLQRLGVTRVDLLTIHDLDYSEHESREVADRLLDQLVNGGGCRALAELQAAGEIRAVGAGVNDVGSITRFAERFEVDYYLLAMPYSLVDQRPLDDELAWCLDHGIGIIKGAPYASGILAADTARAGDRAAGAAATYDYRAPSAEVRSTVSRIAAVCARHGVPMRAAALQFLLAHPAVAAVIPGAATPAEVADNARMLSVSISADLWRELQHERLLQDGAPIPD